MSQNGYSIDLGAWGSVFAVPTALVDEQLRMAGTAQLKTALYLLRHSGEMISMEKLAQAAGISPADARDAVEYWVGAGLFRQYGGYLAPAAADAAAENAERVADEPARRAVNDTAERAAQPAPQITETAAPQPEPQNNNYNSAPAPQPEPAQPETDKPKPRRAERVHYSYDECVKLIGDTPELAQMLQVLEGILGKQLNHTEMSAFVSLVVWHGLPAPCVALLVEYCRGMGKCSIAYIEQTGIGWAQEEIKTVEQADAKIRHATAMRDSWAKVRDVLGIPERKPTAIEEELSLRWIGEWQLGADIIKLAYDRCVDSKGKLSMRYMNGILVRWHESGYKTANEVLESEQAAKPRGDGTQSTGGRFEPTFDIADIEKMMDEEWMSGFGDTGEE